MNQLASAFLSRRRVSFLVPFFEWATVILRLFRDFFVLWGEEVEMQDEDVGDWECRDTELEDSGDSMMSFYEIAVL